MPITAVYAGSFDPFTLGHVDIARRGASLFERVIVAVGTNPAKRYTFTHLERQEIIADALSDVSNVTVDSFAGLLVDYCHSQQAMVILRGLRSEKDLSFEFPIGLANMNMYPEIQTVCLLSDPKHIYVSSSLVKEIACNGGDAQPYLPTKAFQYLQQTLTNGQ